MGRIPGLDGLRGTAAMMVLLSHLSNEKLHLIPGGNLGGTGKSGVYLFFVLSAFLLSHQMREAGSSRLFSWRFLGRYLESRVLRIWPLFVVVCLFCFVSSALGFPLLVEMNASELLQTLLLQRGDFHLWTIPVEFKFYFLLPLIMMLMVGVLGNRTWLCVGATIFLMVAFWYFTPRATVGTNPIPFLSFFLAGTCANYLVAALRGPVSSTR
jgi:peptidoglycan/LPS O-acetylase OafA/YrhL